MLTFQIIGNDFLKHTLIPNWKVSRLGKQNGQFVRCCGLLTEFIQLIVDNAVVSSASNSDAFSILFINPKLILQNTVVGAVETSGEISLSRATCKMNQQFPLCIKAICYTQDLTFTNVSFRISD